MNMWTKAEVENNDRLPLWLSPEPQQEQGAQKMPDMVDASTMKDETRVRRGELAAAHSAALRIEDEGERNKEVAKVEKEIQAEYADEPKAEEPTKAGGK